MTLEEKYIIARWAYSIGKDFISDIEYDGVERHMKGSNLLSEYTDRGWSEDPCPYELLKKYALEEYSVPVMHTFKTESIESIDNMIMMESTFKSLAETTRISYKIDGFALRLNYYNGHLITPTSRNRTGTNAVDMLSIKKLFKQTIPIKQKVLVIGEVYLRNKTLEQYRSLRGIVSQRNGVSTAIANGDVEYLGYRCFNIYIDDVEIEDRYTYLDELGFPLPRNLVVSNYSTMLKGIEVLGRTKNTYDAPSDGLVVENSKTKTAIRIGAWEEEYNSSYITGYVVNRGMYNNSILVAIRPIKLANKTVSEISVTNLQAVIDNNLRIGNPICFVERSGVNSVLETTGTEKLHTTWNNKFEEYRKKIDELE